MKLLNEAHEISDSSQDVFTWAKMQTDKPMFEFWYNVLQSIKNIFLSIRSFHEANIDLMIIALKSMIPLFFSLDHVNYSRWVSVFLEDLKALPIKFPSLYKEFKKGHFVVNVRCNEFSKIAMDQAQEQNNKKIKSSSGYIDLINKDDDQFVKKLEVCMPEIDCYLEAVDGAPIRQGHKENNPTFCKKFIDDCRKVHFKVVTNPFLSYEFCMLNSSYIFPEIVATDSRRVFTIGYQQYQDFCKSRFIFGNEPLGTKISKNLLKLPKDTNNIQQENQRITINESLLNKLRDSCTFRKEIAREVFKSEWTRLPECFVTKDGLPYHNIKSNFLDCIGPEIANSVSINASATVIDLSVIIRSHIIEPGMTFQSLASSILERIIRIANEYCSHRIDIVADQYNDKSIKHHTRLKRKKAFGQQMNFSPETVVPVDFLTNDTNKKKLNEYLCHKFAALCPTVWGKKFCISNKLVNVLTNDGEKEIYQQNLISIHEEADNRIISHIDDLIDQGHQSIVVRTGDSDVIIILLSFMGYFLSKDPLLIVHVEMKTSGRKRLFNMNDSYVSLGQDICSALPFFHCFTGADSTCSFFKISKKNWFSSWKEFHLFVELCQAFFQMSICPTKKTVFDNLGTIKDFVSFTYFKNLSMDIDELRLHLFQTKCTSDLRCLPPSQDALTLHCLRSAYQSGWIWGNTLSQNTPPSPTN